MSLCAAVAGVVLNHAGIGLALPAAPLFAPLFAPTPSPLPLLLPPAPNLALGTTPTSASKPPDASSAAPPPNPPPTSSPAIVQVELSYEFMSRLAESGTFRWRLPGPYGQTLGMYLEPFEILAPGAVLMAQAGEASRVLARPEVLLLRGAVDGAPGSRVFLGITPFGVHGFITGLGEDLYLSSGPAAAGQPPLLFGASQLAQQNAPPPEGTNNAAPGATAAAPGDATAGPAVCLHVDSRRRPPPPRPTETSAPDHPAALPAAPPGDKTNIPPCRVIEVAIETDWEFNDYLFSAYEDSSAAYALLLTAASSEIFRTEINASLQITFLRIWDSPADPWASLNLGPRLGEFQAHWNANMGSVPYDAAHMYSGIPGSGGAAINALCSNFREYALTILAGTFPYPLQTNIEANHDVALATHEWGHLFGATHTHELSPPVDLCGHPTTPSCVGAEHGTLMSYCERCPGGYANIALALHPRSIDQIEFLLAVQQCTNPPAATIALGEGAATAQGYAIDVDVLANEAAANCGAVAIDSFSAASAAGGTVTLIAGGGPTGLDALRYTPPEGFWGEDSFTYQAITGGRPPSQATCAVAVLPMRAPDARHALRPRLDAAYYALPPMPAHLPDFGSLAPAATGAVDAIDFPGTSGAFAGSGLSDNVGAVFEGVLVVPVEGLYEFTLVSDDGSRLLIGSQSVVESDGVRWKNWSRERSGSVALAAGTHDLRVEYFERALASHLVASIAGPGMARQPIPAAMLHRVNPCRPDLTSTAIPGQPGHGIPNGTLNNDDFFYYTSEFANANAGVADLTHGATPGTTGYGVPDGVLNGDDFLFYLAIFSAGC